MSDDAPTTPRPPVFVVSVDGTQASDNGEQVKIGFTLESGQEIDAILPTDRATDLIGLVGAALGEAARRRSGDPNVRYLYQADRWELRPQLDERLLTFAFRLRGGAEMCFQFDREEARQFNEALSVILGAVEVSTVPPNQRH